MNDITKSPYFFWGSAGATHETGAVQYGLYELITNRLVLVSKFPEALNKVAAVFASRFNLMICKLDTAENFSTELIDNSCCYDWTVTMTDNVTVNNTVTYVNQPIKLVNQIIKATAISPDELIVKDQEYILAAFQWITNFEYEQLLKGQELISLPELSLGNTIKLPMPISSSTAKIQEMSNIMFAEFDFATAKDQIETLRDTLK